MCILLQYNTNTQYKMDELQEITKIKPTTLKPILDLLCKARLLVAKVTQRMQRLTLLMLS